MKHSALKRQNLIQLILTIVIVVLAAFISGKAFFRIDLTSEHRFTLSSETKVILKKLDDVVFVKVYLDGDMPAGFKKLRTAIKEDLDEFRIYGKENIQYQFINPSESPDKKKRDKIYRELVEKGVKPTNIQLHDKEGGASERILFPGVLLSYNGIEIPVNLLKNNVILSPDENLNNSVQGIEYEIIRAINNLTNKKVDKIAFLEGHGELNELQVADISHELANFFEVDRGIINGKSGVLDSYKAVIVAKPSKSFTEQDKYVLDQYIMNGGKVLWLIDEVNVNADSLAGGSTFAVINNLNIEDQLFTYGVRINPNLIQDVQCNVIPINTALAGNPAKWTPSPWLYFPLVAPMVGHPVTRNLNLLFARYANEIDTLKGNGEVRHTVLLKTSAYTKLVNAPLFISLEEIRHTPAQKDFNKSGIPVAVLLEGRVTSVFKDRPVGSIIPGAEKTFKELSMPTSMIVVSDGDLIANDVRMTANGPVESALGYDKYTRQTFGNKDFIVNAINYLTETNGLMSLRSKEFKLRILNKAKIREEKLKWELINTIVPVLLLMIFGMYYHFARKRRYAAVKN